MEAYVLDALTPEEKQAVEANMAQHPEVAAEVQAIEEGMLSIARAGAEEPPAELEEQIWNAIVREQAAQANETIQQPVSRTRPLPVGTQAPRSGFQRAAIWAAFFVSVLTNFILLSQRNESRSRETAMNQRLDSLKQEQQVLVAAMENYRKEKDMLADTAMQAVVMKTMLPGHPMAATVYWSKENGDTYLAMQKLPMPPTGKQYQMWVIQDGKPVSMGVIPNDMVSTGKVAKLPMQVMHGQAFAISLENEGGNATPTEVQVLGKV